MGPKKGIDNVEKIFTRVQNVTQSLDGLSYSQTSYANRKVFRKLRRPIEYHVAV